ncbi:MAG: hypothetical protein JJT81_02360 [Rubellimicrobium sp.]|nr:hypothetical protein [Rubellimicrobium sp.]
MGRIIALEPFDRPNILPEPVGPSPEWSAGHAAGLADGLDMAAQRQGILAEEICQAMTELTFTYAEARAQVLASLAPLLHGLLDRLLPAIVPDILRMAILEALVEAADGDSRMPLVVRVHPAHLAPLAPLVGTLPGHMPVIEGASGIGPGQALVESSAGETLLDIDGLLEAIRQSLAVLSENALNEVRHG